MGFKLMDEDKFINTHSSQFPVRSIRDGFALKFKFPFTSLLANSCDAFYNQLSVIQLFINYY